VPFESVAFPLPGVTTPRVDDPAPLSDTPDAGGQANAARLSLRLIATSDLHACLLPYDYCANRPVIGRSLSEISRQIALARAEVPNSLLFDNGDFLQGNPLADYVATARRRRRAHPVITAFNTLGYDAVTLGNHEFNYGLRFLRSALSQAQFPVVSANIATKLGKSPSRDETFVPPFAILTRRVTDTEGCAHTLRIGVIGFAPPQIEVWDRDHLEGHIRMRDIIASAKAWLPRLRARGADVIVALAHSGIGALEAESGMENAATALAALPEVDAVIAGHCHLTFPGPGIEDQPGVDPVLGLLAGKPAVMPGHSGSHVGVIDLALKHSTHGKRRWTVSAPETRVGLRPSVAPSVSAPTLPSPELMPLRHAIAQDHRATLAWSRRIVGQTRVNLGTHFATTAPNAALDLIAAAKGDYARLALEGTRWAELPLLSSAAPFRAGGRGGAANFTDIPAGPVRMRNLSDLYIFPNTLVVLALTGLEVMDWLEQSAALFRQIQPGETDAVLHDVAVPSFTYETIPSLDYAIDLSQPARFDPDGQLINPKANRIVGLTRNGQRVDPDERMLLVTNNHRASRAAVAPGDRKPVVVLADGALTQTVLANYIRREGVVGAPPKRNWHFLPMPGTSVRIETGVGAEAYLSDIAPFRPQALDRDAEGFMHYRLYL
jgi:2',3'-cyclic-nucleotide 2'-phosphodiesterase / 3'-nucleotidase